MSELFAAVRLGIRNRDAFDLLYVRQYSSSQPQILEPSSLVLTLNGPEKVTRVAAHQENP